MHYSQQPIPISRIWLVPPGQAPSEVFESWRHVHEKYALFASPFLSPDYTRLVARCRPDIEMAVLEAQGEAVGFFAFERCGPRAARPVGSIFCDYQALIAPPTIWWSAEELMCACNLDELSFDHWLGVQSQMLPFARLFDVSWAIDLREGFAAYEKSLATVGRRALADAHSKEKRLLEAVGPIRFEPDLPDLGLLDLLLKWKSRQWARSGWPGRFEDEWERNLMRELLFCRGETFGGIFSALFAGDVPVALHMGLRSHTVWHYWTTAYDTDYQRYSPGIILLAHMARTAEGLGLKAIDLGKETFEYKMRFSTHHIPLIEGQAKRITPEV